MTLQKLTFIYSSQYDWLNLKKNKKIKIAWELERGHLERLAVKDHKRSKLVYLRMASQRERILVRFSVKVFSSQSKFHLCSVWFLVLYLSDCFLRVTVLIFFLSLCFCFFTLDRYNKSVPQVLIRWSVQKNYITIPKSSKPERIQENADVFDFSISDDDMKTLVRSPL